MKKIAFTVSAFISSILFTTQGFSQESLYKRLGGYDAIAAVTDDFIGRLASDKDISRFFVGLSNDSKTKIRQHIVDFLCNKSGGPCAYVGRSMKDTHKGLKITEKDWKTSADLLADTLKKFNVGKKETDEVFAFVSSLKNDIVEMQ